jgi:hypothetical protein
MVKYVFKPDERPVRFIDITVGAHKRKVPFMGFVAFTTKTEAKTYSQARLIEGKKCKIIVPDLKGKKWHVPFIYPPEE